MGILSASTLRALDKDATVGGRVRALREACDGAPRARDVRNGRAVTGSPSVALPVLPVFSFGERFRRGGGFERWGL